jgi:hypothetical protein
MINNNAVDLKGPVFDQFVLAEQVGIVNSSRMMKILRHVRKSDGPIGEGTLAAKCCERLFLPEWPIFINQLLQWGYIEVKPTGRGIYRNVSLTVLGEEFLEHTIGPKMVDQPTEVTSGTVNA